MYLAYPNGAGRSEMKVPFEKLLGVRLTARNWNTVVKLRGPTLRAMSHASTPSPPPSSRWPTASCGARSPPSTPPADPNTRILHPIWEWDGEALTGWIATSPLSPKAKDLAERPAI